MTALRSRVRRAARCVLDRCESL